jgi:phthiocerol/phenolphthiocerol synthesis type-I polyketide synthase E
MGSMTDLAASAGTHAAMEIAVIGMACRFPGAGNVVEFWGNLSRGIESISRFGQRELMESGVDPGVLHDTAYVPVGGVVEGIDMFDADFFGITPRMADILDPQHRLMLECSWEALVAAGYDTSRFKGSIGMFGGQAHSDYMKLVEANQELAKLLGSRTILIANDKDHLTTSVSYRLDLRGPAITVQTTCSTSLVAIHLACQSLLGRECDMALAGGVSLRVPQQVGYFSQQGVTARDGHCRAFDASADGSVPSGGAGVVLLKPLMAAVADGDQIHAVIKGSALSNDGSAKVGYTAPGVTGQVAAISEALEVADVPAETVGYVEAHGTGTPLGDPIEIAALTAAYREQTGEVQYCPIGSVKTNIGHTDAAAGVAGFIKVVLALEHEAIPPSLHFERPNPEIDFGQSPFFVNTSLRPWSRTGVPRRAGVSSFGIGGTNAHAVLEEAPEPEPGGPAVPWQVITLSAKTPPALHLQARRIGKFLGDNPDTCLADAAHTLRIGRRELPHRLVAVCADTESAAAALTANGSTADVPIEERTQGRFECQAGEPKTVAFMFPGGSARYETATGELYEWEPTFRAEIDRCAELLQSEIAADIRTLLYPEVLPTDGERPPVLVLPSLFATEYALARLWMSWGVRPSAMIGHSLGEYVAACLAGVLDLPEALRLVSARSRLIQSLPDGAMLSVALPEGEVVRLIDSRLSVAAVNAPDMTVVSGPANAVTEFGGKLAGQGVSARLLPISAAGHSAMIEPIMDEFAAFVGTLRLAPPKIPYVSGITGGWISADQATDPAYWARHLRETVRFSAGIGSLLGSPNRALLEIGPGRALSSLALRHPGRGATHPVLASLPHQGEPGSRLAFLYTTVGRLWTAGGAVDWSSFRDRERRRRVALPGYPLDRRRHWITGRRSEGNGAGADAAGVGAYTAEELCQAQLDVMRKQLELLEGNLGA